MAQRRIRALLIGVDGYLESRRPGFGAPPSLAGSVRDALAAEAFLRQRLQVPEADVALLLAPAGGASLDPARAPSYENIVGAWQRLIASSEPGDQAFILFSGHGCRVPSTSRTLKGMDGLDECLVPYDIAERRARYLRDTEICMLLARLAERQVFTTVVLDCCHSGGASRDSVAVRGSDAIDRSPRDSASLVSGVVELESMWRQRRPASRAVRADPAQDEPAGYVLFAACRPHEQAFEACFDDQPPRGALSYWFFRLLESAEPSWSWRRVHERLVSRVRAKFLTQTPLLEGEGDREIFGGGRLPPAPKISVVEVDGDAGVRLRLAAGKAHGLREGASFAIVSRSSSSAGTRLGVVEAREVSATSSWAELVERSTAEWSPVEGDEALLLDSGSLCLRRPVRSLAPVLQADAGSWRAAPTPSRDLLVGLRDLASPFLDLDGEEDLEGFLVWVDPRGVLQIGDAAGRPWPGLEPPIRLQEPGALARLAKRLDHLAKWRNVREIENQDEASALRDRVRVWLGRLPHDHRRGQPVRPRPLRASEHPPTVAAGDWICVVIENASRQPLNLAVLDLAPDWSITQVHPAKALQDFVTLEPGKTLKVPLCAGLPRGLGEGEDVIKVFATRGTLRLDWLELPALDQSHVAAERLRGTASGALDRLLASLAVDAPVCRSARLPPEAADDWWVEEAVVRVVARRAE